MLDLEDPNRLAELHRHSLPDAELVGWREVGIAIFPISVRVVLLVQKPMDTIDQFILRSLLANIDGPDDIASLLGLDTSTVTGHLAGLNGKDLVRVIKQPDRRIQLTSLGESVAREMKTTELLEFEIPVWFHGFLRKPIPYRRNSLLSGSQCRDDGVFQIAARGGKPKLEEILLSDLKPIIAEYLDERRDNSDRRPSEVVGIKEVQKSGGMLYQPCLLLGYDAKGGSDRRQYSFVLEGVRKTDYDRAFDQLLLPKDFLLNPVVRIEDAVKEYLPEHLHENLEDLRQAEELVEQEDLLVQQVDDDVIDNKEEAESKTEQLAAVRKELEAAKAIHLRTNDCDKLLGKAISDASISVRIVSGTISGFALSHIEKLLVDALNRGVEVFVGYGMGGQDRQSQAQRGRDSFGEAVAILRKLSERFKGRLTVADLGDLHSKILVCDDKFVAVGSYNWLAYKPSGKKPRREHAVRLNNVESIEWYIKECDYLFSRGKPLA